MVRDQFRTSFRVLASPSEALIRRNSRPFPHSWVKSCLLCKKNHGIRILFKATAWLKPVKAYYLFMPHAYKISKKARIRRSSYFRSILALLDLNLGLPNLPSLCFQSVLCHSSFRSSHSLDLLNRGSPTIPNLPKVMGMCCFVSWHSLSLLCQPKKR